MIKIENLNKSFGTKNVLKNLNLEIKDGEVFGLVGINGAGKSTLLRTICGVYKPELGKVSIDNINVFENPNIKKDIFFLADDPYFPINSTAQSVLNFYKSFYKINHKRFYDIISKFNLDITRTINNYSKGMKRQLYIALALAIAPKYLLLDEAFDGLDPLARLIFKRSLNEVLEEKQITVIISSHSLRELEDICDSYGLLDNGTITNTGSIEDRKAIYHKYQLAFSNELNKEDFSDLDIVSFNRLGRIIKVVIRGDEDEITNKLKNYNPLLIDKINIDFEELFIIEVERKGYINE